MSEVEKISFKILSMLEKLPPQVRASVLEMIGDRFCLDCGSADGKKCICWWDD